MVDSSTSYWLKCGYRLVLHFEASCSRAPSSAGLKRNYPRMQWVFFCLHHYSHPVTPNTQPFESRNRFMLAFTITLFTLSSFAVYNIAFGLARLIFLPLLLRVPLVRSLLNPCVGHFITGPWTLTLPFRHFSLESHALTLGVFTLANWEFAEALCDFYIPQVRHLLSSCFIHLKAVLAG